MRILVWLSGLLLMLAFVACNNPDPCQCAADQVCEAGKCVPKKTDEKPADGKGTDAGPVDKDEVVKEQDPPKDDTKVKAWLWRPSTSGTSNDLWGISFGSATSVWVVGAKGTILVSRDAGLTWKAQKSGTSNDLFSVWFIDDKRGWAVGDKGTVLRTENGGEKWETLNSSTNSALRSVQFFNKSQGVVVGDDFTFMKTGNSGDTWQSTSKSTDINFYAVTFPTQQIGIAAGTSGTIVYTTNAGQLLTNALTGTDKTFFGLFFFDDKNGFAVGEDGFLRKSDDGGQGWSSIDMRKFQVDLHGIWFVNKNRGWIVGQDGLIIGTNDGGKTWLSESSAKNPTLLGIRMHSRTAGVIVGKGGTIISMQEVSAECNTGDQRDCYTGPAGTKDVGVCSSGKQTCTEGLWGACVGQRLPASKEICFNGDDDNCNGKSDSDDGCPACKVGDVKTCYTGPKGTQGTGECRAGQQTCNAKNEWGTCEKQTVPGNEKCDGKDNDCDGSVDEDIKPADMPACDNSFGVCGGKKKICVKGKPAACTAKEYGADYQSKEDKCDGKDNDCDGVVDEGCPCKADFKPVDCYTGPKGTAGVGACKKGQQTCKDSKLTACVGQVKPVKEICADKIDNNCNGNVDEVNQWALAFDSRRRAHVLIKDAAALQPTAGITVEGHFFVRNIGQRTRSLVSRSQNGGYSLLLDFPQKGDLSGRVWLKGAKAFTYVTIKHKGVLKNDTWFHIAFTYDGSALRLFVNGKKVGEKAARGTISYPANKPVALIFGAEPGDANAIDRRAPNYFYGSIAEVRLSGKAIYDKDFTPDCTLKATGDTIGFWQLDNGTGAKKVTASNGKFEGELKGPTWQERIRCKGFAKGGCVKPAP